MDYMEEPTPLSIVSPNKLGSGDQSYGQTQRLDNSPEMRLNTQQTGRPFLQNEDVSHNKSLTNEGNFGNYQTFKQKKSIQETEKPQIFSEIQSAKGTERTRNNEIER